MRNNIRAHDDHTRNQDSAKSEDKPEALEDLWHFLEEIRAFDFLLGGAPSDVVGNAVGNEGLGEVDGETAEEEEAGGDQYRTMDNEDFCERLTRTAPRSSSQSRYPTNSSSQAYTPKA